MRDVECPYCNIPVEINHDDGYGYEEDRTHTQECPSCEKVFAFTTAISYSYEATQAPCKNGEAHNLRPIHGIPKELFVGRSHCTWCGEEVIVDEAAHQEARAAYAKRINSPSGHREGEE